MNREDFENWFGEFWKLFPRRVGKLDAKRAYVQALHHATPDEINEGARAYARERSGQEPQYTKHPAGWLRSGRWADERPPEPTSGAGEFLARFEANTKKQLEEREQQKRH